MDRIIVLIKFRGFIDDEFSNPAFALGYQKDGNATYQDSKKRAVSYYLNFGYAYDDRYLLDVNYRSDGSSVFGSDRQFTNTWSVGLGWNIHKEAFFSDIEGISLLKLRASIGNPGNQNFDDYISTRIYTYNTDNMNIFRFECNRFESRKPQFGMAENLGPEYRFRYYFPRQSFEGQFRLF